MQCIQDTVKLIKSEPLSECDIIDPSNVPQRMDSHVKIYNTSSCPVQKHQFQDSNMQPSQKVILSSRMDYSGGYHQNTGGSKLNHAYVTSNDPRSRSPTVINSSYHQHSPHQQHAANTQPTPQIIITQSTGGGTPVRVIRDGRFYEESQRMANPSSPASSPPPLAPTSSGLHHSAASPMNVQHSGAGSSDKYLEQSHPQQASSSMPMPSNRKFIVSRAVNVISRNKIDNYNNATTTTVSNNNMSRLNANSGAASNSDGFRTPVVSSSGSNMCNNATMRPPPPPPPKIKTITNMTNCGSQATTSNNSEEPSSSIPDLEFDGTTVLCRVCGDKASGFHYGVHSCEGCKGFFRRSIQQKIQYRPCTKNQQCSILRINRNRCQYCRLKKCIAVGMSRDAVRFGRVPKREKARILAAMQQSTQNRGQQRALATELDDQPRLLAAVLRAHMETCEFTKEKVSAMRQRARECPSYSMPTLLACPLNPAPELQSEQEFSQRFAHVIRGVIDFAGMIPGFQLLTQDDKFTLLKAGLFDALFVRLICMFDPSINSIICLNGQVMRRDAIQNGANARFLVDSTFNFAERINSMNLTDTEIGLFCAIVLITPDRPGLRNIELIEKMYSRLKACLQTVIAQNRPNQPEFMSELLKTLPDLRTLSTLHTEKLVVFRTEHKELLRQQMWTVEEDHISKSPGSSTWDTTVEDVAKSPLGSVSSTESGDLDYSQTSLASSAPLLAATLSGTCPLRHRANSGSSAEDVDIVGSHAHLTQNGLSITPVVRSHHSHSHLNGSRYRKLDSPTDSGIESGNEKAESTKTVSSGGGSSCSSPRSTVEDVMDDQHHSHAQSGAGSNVVGAKRQIAEDMPVLKRVLQAPPLYDTNSLMDEAYKPHKKFRALRHRDFETAEADTHVQRSTTVSPPPASNSSCSNANSSATSASHQQPQSQLHMHLTRNTNTNGSSHSSLSSTHSVLAKSLMEEPRMTPEQMKRSDIIQNYIMREQPTSVNGLLVCASNSPTSSTSGSTPNMNNCSSSSTTTITLASPPLPPPHPMRWQSHSVITTTTLRNQSVSPVNNTVNSSSYFQSPHSTSISSSPRASPSSRVQSPRLIELQVDIADSQQPLNLSKKSPTPPPSHHGKMSQAKVVTTAIQRSPYHHPVAADITVTTATTNSATGASVPPTQMHKVLLEA